MDENQNCPIWETEAKDLPNTKAYNGRIVYSPRAGGNYKIRRDAETNLKQEDPRVKCQLTTWIVDQHRLGTRVPEIDVNVLNDIKHAKPLLVAQRRDRFLLWFQKESLTLGQEIVLYATSLGFDEQKNGWELAAWSECLDKSELIFLLNFCAHEGLLKSADGNSYSLTFKGYDHLETIETKTIGEQAFVAMWFHKSMMEVYKNGIAPAIERAGYKPFRIDEEEHVDRVDDRIIAEIRRSRFVVADFTSEPDKPRGGVYFEAGFAHGRGIPVIWTCREDMIDKQLHFDMRQFNHLVWSTSEDLCDRLKTRIEAVIGEGPLKRG